jgi:hypothetical protein
LQLHHVREDRLPAHHRAGPTLPPAVAISTYTFNTGVAKHLFCPKCGIKAFYVPRSNPDGYSVNLRCLDDPDDFTEVKIVPFNGRSDWEGQAHTLAHKSKD